MKKYGGLAEKIRSGSLHGRRLGFVFRHGCAVRAEYFQALVVAVDRLAAVVDRAHRAVGKLEDDHIRINVAEFV